MVIMTTDLRPQESAEAQGEKKPALPRVAALPGADRRIVRKRLEWPLKTARKEPRAAGGAGR